MNNGVGALMEKRTRAFPLGPDNTALFPGREYRRAIAGLREGVERGCRLLCLVGPAGIGKSMLLRTLRGQLPLCRFREISQPPLGGLLSRLAAGLGADAAGDEAAVQRRIRECYFASRPGNTGLIQVIDDAESLSRDDLALVRRLFDPVRGQILLAGQPQLLSLFSADDGTWTELQPDRIYYLEPLVRDEIGAYIRHRLNEAGFDRELFVPEAIDAVAAYSGGLPRLINLLCFSALASSEFDVSTRISAECIHDAARQRMEIGNYPFMSPPSASGRLSGRPPASPGDASKPIFGGAELDEPIAIVAGDRRVRGKRFARFGSGRVLLLLAAGAAAGITITRMSQTGVAGPDTAPGFPATALSRVAEPYVQGMKAGLVDMAEWIIAWAGPESASVNSAAMAQGGDAGATVATAAQPASRKAAASGPAAAAQQGAMPPRLATSDNHPAVAAEQAPSAPPAPPAADSAKAAAVAAPEQAAEKTNVVEANSAQDRGSAARQKQDEAASARLSAAEREHLARLYAERAHYDIQSGRLQDALISVRRGLRLAPDDAELRELKHSVGAAGAAMPDEGPRQTATGRMEEDSSHAIPPSPTAQIDPARSGNTGRDMQLTKYQWPNPPRDAVIGIGYGLQTTPVGGASQDMKLDAQERIAGQK